MAPDELEGPSRAIRQAAVLALGRLVVCVEDVRRPRSS